VKIAGVDGCRAGWVAAVQDLEMPGAIEVYVFGTFAGVADPGFALLAVDIPIGLPDSGPRAADLEARRLLGARRSSVFPAPIRPVLRASDYVSAYQIGRRVHGKGLSNQAWGSNPRKSRWWATASTTSAWATPPLAAPH
jgi:predicted RNase H-like nuclease